MPVNFISGGLGSGAGRGMSRRLASPTCLPISITLLSGGWAIKILQKKAGVDEDGAWGPNTKQAVSDMFAKLEAEIETNPHADNEFVRWYDSERRYFIRSLKRDDEKGIMARLDKREPRHA